jgi:predicted cupin superfamily sugar epimerase
VVDAGEVISLLGLEAHPEGGYYRETWRDDSATAIYFLLDGRRRSAWHRLADRAEVWHFYRGAPIELSYDLDEPGGPGTVTVRLGRDLEAGEVPQAVVPPGAWQCARTLGEWSLAGCTVAPPFSFEAFEMGSRD